MFRIAAIVVALYISLFAGRDGLAAFVNGVEQFHGTQIDPVTWATSPNGLFVIQNNSITLPGGGGYTTTSPLVPVGGSVWSEVRVNSFVPSNQGIMASLVLDTTPFGVDSFLHDGSNLAIEASYSSSPGFNFVTPGERATINGIETSYAEDPFQLSALPLGSTYIFQIERLSSATDRFSMFAETGPHAGGGINIELVNSEVVTQLDIPADMYVSLQGNNLSTTFFSVTINHAIGQDQSFVVLPEPSTLFLAALGGLALLAWRGR